MQSAAAPSAPAPNGTSGFATQGANATLGGSAVVSGAPSASITQLTLPACVKDGNCSLADIVQTGVNFTTLIMGLSGALFFAVFLYGGALYLASFGNKKYVEKGKAAIKGAAIGMFFVLTSWAIVRTIVNGLGAGKALQSGSSVQNSSQCAQVGAGYSCTTLKGTTTADAQADAASQNLSCQTGLCPGTPSNVLCCKSN